MATQTGSRAYAADSPQDGASTNTATVETTITQTGVDKRFECLIARAIIVESEHVAVGPVISIGANSPNYNDLVGAQVIGGIVGEVVELTLAGSIQELPEGTEIKCKVVTAAIPTLGHSATFTFRPVLFGIEGLYSE